MRKRNEMTTDIFVLFLLLPLGFFLGWFLGYYCGFRECHMGHQKRAKQEPYEIKQDSLMVDYWKRRCDELEKAKQDNPEETAGKPI